MATATGGDTLLKTVVDHLDEQLALFGRDHKRWTQT